MNKGQFVKGHTGYWKGRKQSAETIAKKVKSMTGKTHPMPEGYVVWNKGIKTGLVPNSAFKKGSISWNKGKKCYQLQGSNCGAWKGGITPLYTAIRNSTNMRQWRSDVYTRDKFTCQHCGDCRGGNLNAHHVKPFSMILSERNIKTIDDAYRCEELWNINNGITLCQPCHIKVHI